MTGDDPGYPRPVTPIVRPVILSGGAGTRLWPLSTERRPKQFLELAGGSLFESTLRRLDGIPGLVSPTVVTRGEHLDQVAASAEAAGVGLGSLIVEPTPRNTAPAVLAAALTADPDDVLLVLPSDHVIADPDGFGSAVARGVALARDGALVTFGATPTRPEAGYGYIEAGAPVDGGYEVVRFKEKPDVEEAAHLLSIGGHYWNSGMFVFEAGALIGEAETHCPVMLAGVRRALPDGHGNRIDLGAAFGKVASESIDRAIMEKTSKAIVIPIDVGWSDVGSWQSLWELSEKDAAGNVLVGEVDAIDVTNSYIHSATRRRLAVVGVDGLVVVGTDDATLVVPMERSQVVRDLAPRRD